MADVRQITIALAGAGARAQQHLETLACLPAHYRVAGVSDFRRERAEETAARLGVPAFGDTLQMLDAVRPDALFVLVPPDGHHPLAVAAAERGVHVLCEVPISITLPLADLMIDACRRAGVVLEVCENVPRKPAERLKQEVVRRGLLGEVLLARLQYASGAYHGLSAVRRLLPGRPARAWGFQRALPALPLVDFTGIVHDRQDWEFGYVAFDGVDGQTAPTLLYEQPPRPGGRNSWEVVGTLGRITDDAVHLLHEGADGRRREVTYRIQYELRPRPGTVPGPRTDGGPGSPGRGQAGTTSAPPAAGGAASSNPAETLVRAYVETDPPVAWEDPAAGLGLPGGQDDVARASQLLTFHRAVTEGTAPEYGAAEARTDLELLLALRQSARQGSVPVDLPLRAVTEHERALHEEYRLTYGRDPLASPQQTAGALYPRGGITHRVTHDRIGEIRS